MTVLAYMVQSRAIDYIWLWSNQYIPHTVLYRHACSVDVTHFIFVRVCDPITTICVSWLREK